MNSVYRVNGGSGGGSGKFEGSEETLPLGNSLKVTNVGGGRIGHRTSRKRLKESPRPPIKATDFKGKGKE